MRNEMNSAGISKWASGHELKWAGKHGIGDSMIVGWIRDDGARAISTNGDPEFDGEDGFEEAWQLIVGSSR